MKLTHIVESKQQLIEQHKRNSLMLLVESTQGLDRDQQQVVENVYRHFIPLIEASLSKDQIQQLFTSVEQGATAAGGNRTAIGKSKDVVEKVNKIINDAGKWLQDTTPVKNFDARFEKLKNDINKKFPDSKILDGISNMAMWAEKNPGKTAAIVGILTAIASLAGGPIGGAIAGQVLRGSVELLKGEKLSTAIGKGVKTAVFGYLSGKAFEMLGEFAEGMRIKSIPFGPEDAGLEQISYGASKTISSPGMEWTREIQGVNITVDPEMASAVRSATNMLRMGGDAANEGFEQLQNVAEIINSQEYRQEMASVWKGAFEATKNNDSLLNFIKTAKEGLQAASQGAVAAAGVASDGKEKKESVKRVGRKLSEGQVYMLFKRVDVAQDFLAEAGLLSKVGGAIKGAVGKLGQKLTTTGKNLTTKVTADKLNSAWQKAGSPTDSEEIFDFLTQQGVNKEVIAPVYDTMKLPVPKSASQDEPADDKQAAQGQKLNPAAAEPGQEPKPGTVGLQTQPGETPQAQIGNTADGKPVDKTGKTDYNLGKQSNGNFIFPGQKFDTASGEKIVPKAAAQDEPATDQPANKPVDVVALANEIKASDPNITGDVKKMLDDDLKQSQKQQVKPAVDQTQPAPATA
jgi:hypothetical protein